MGRRHPRGSLLYTHVSRSQPRGNGWISAQRKATHPRLWHMKTVKAGLFDLGEALQLQRPWKRQMLTAEEE